MSFRKHRISDHEAKVHAFHKAGLYDDPDIQWDILWRFVLDALLSEIEQCPVGDGNKYRDLVADTLSIALGYVVDESLIRKEFPSEGGRGDIELPLRTEVIDEFPIWRIWSDRYGIRSIVVETKNLKSSARVEHVRQIHSDLAIERQKKGTFGFLISRNGFSEPAITRLRNIAETRDFLILPFSNEEFAELARRSLADVRSSMEFLRQKETMLLQTA